MHPEMERQMAAERVKELRRAGAVARLRAVAPQPEPLREVVIREARAQDQCALAALAELDGAEPPLGRTLLAEIDGSIVAALPLEEDASPLADPFRHTADLVALLEARAKQIAAAPERKGPARLRWLARYV